MTDYGFEWNPDIMDLTLASPKIKNMEGEMYLNWKFQGTEDFRKSWIKALEGTLSHSLITASFSDEFTGYCIYISCIS